MGHMSKILDQNIEIARKEIDDNNLFIETTIDILEKFQKRRFISKIKYRG